MAKIHTPRESNVTGKIFSFLEACGVTLEQTETVIEELKAEVERQKSNLNRENEFKYCKQGGLNCGKND